MAEEKTFVKPWAEWTPEMASFYADALAGKNDFLKDAGATPAQQRRLLNNVEGYWAERDAERTLEKNAPLFSKKGLRNQSRLVFPKANESIDANRPLWMTALHGGRDLITLTQRAGIQIGGDLQNAGRALLGFELVDPESYSMGNASSLVGNDPLVAATATPGAPGSMLLGGLRESGASVGGKILGKVGLPKVGKALGGYAGEGAALSGMEFAGNLGDVDRNTALLMGLGGTALARAGEGAVHVGGKASQRGAQYATRKKYNINTSDQRKDDLLRREFGGERLPKENELLFLESGELGREPIAAEAVAGEGSGWAKRTGAVYEKVAAEQNARLEDALALRPQVGEGAKARSLATRTDGLPVSAPTAPGSKQATEFRASLERAGIKPSELIVREGETSQVALAREMNRREAYIQKAEAQIESLAERLAGMEEGAEREAFARRLDEMNAEVRALRENLDRAATLADELDLGLVPVERLAKETRANIRGEIQYTNDLSNTGREGAEKKAAEIVDDLEKTARFKDWNVDEFGNPNGSGRFIPSGKLRGMVSGITKRQLKGASADKGVYTDTQTAAMNFRKAKNKVDQKQSQGTLGETANVESLRHAIFGGLWNKQPTVDNANRMTIGNLTGFLQRQPFYDKALTKVYQFGTSLVPRTAEQQVARRALGLEESAGGELGNMAKNILSTVGREASHLAEVGEENPTQKAWDNIDAFVANINNLKRSQK